jgi:alpha-mannosidase
MRSDYADFPFDGSNPVHVVDITTGAEVPFQLVVRDGKKYLRILASQIPSMGYKVFEIRNGVGQDFASAVSLNGKLIENQYYQVTVAENGAIVSWKDKTRNNRELVKSSNGLAVNDLGTGAGSIRVENEGAVSVTLVAESESLLSHICRVTLFRDLARVEIQNEIKQNFDETQTWAFGFDLNNPFVWHEEVGAIINARLTTEGGHYSPRDFNSRYDWLTLNHFVDMSDGNLGVTLSNADCYFMRLGNSTVSRLDTRTPQISVLAGGRVVGTGSGIYDQGGEDSFLQRFALTSHGAYDPVFAMKFALEHQNPFVAGEVKGGSGYPDNSYSFLAIDNPNVLLWALKPADDGIDAGIVIRLWNVLQDKQEFSLRVGGGIKKALNLSHIETPIGEANVRDGALVDSLNPQQMKTYTVFTEKSGVPVVAPVSPSATVTPPDAVVKTPTAPVDMATPSPMPATDVVPVPEGKGCMLGLLTVLFGLFK